MRVLVQRVKEARVSSDGKEIGSIGAGLCLFLGVAKGDDENNVRHLAKKIVELRIFEDDSGKLNRSLMEVKGDILLVSEFTLYGDCTRGRRPAFSRAAVPQDAEQLYRVFARSLEHFGIKVAKGRFQAKMEVTIINDGPVTFILDSAETCLP